LPLYYVGPWCASAGHLREHGNANHQIYGYLWRGIRSFDDVFILILIIVFLMLYVYCCICVYVLMFSNTLFLWFSRSLLGCLFPIPRILYAMSSDGLLCKFLSTINEKTKTPVVATMICGVGTGKRAEHVNYNVTVYEFSLSKPFFQACCRLCSISNNSSRWRLLAHSCRIWWFASVYWYSGVHII